MKKIAVVSYGMSDMILPMMKHFSAAATDVEVTLILVYARNFRKEGVVDLGTGPLRTGFLPDADTARILGPQLEGYIAGSFSVRIFVNHSVRFRSVRNALLSLSLMQALWKYDLIHINGINGTFLHLLPLLRLKKWMITVHDLVQHSGEQSRSGRKLLEAALNRARQIIIQNMADCETLRESAPQWHAKTRFIPFGYLDVYPAFLPESPAKGVDSDILFFGRISKYKGLEYLMQALERLHAKGLRPSVVLAGSGDHDFGLERLRSVGDIQFIHRHLENSELADLIARTRMVVCPYTDATQSGVLMTSFAFGKPVVATSVGGFKDVVIDGWNGLLVPPRQAGPLAAALESLLIEPGRLEEMARHIREQNRLDTFAWPRISGALIHAYRHLMEEAPEGAVENAWPLT